jgi:UDPglucose 6-dehydrogenase
MVGTGYVGLVSSVCFAEMGNEVSCVDANAELIGRLNSGQSHIFEPGLEGLLAHNHREGRLAFTVDLEQGLQGAKVVFICVGTPALPDGSCDLSHIKAVASEIGRKMTAPLVVVDKSTVPVGTADMVRGVIEDELRKRELNIEFCVASNPEFLKEGDAVNDFMKPDRVIVGTDSPKAAELLKILYEPFARSRDKFIVMSVRSAEMTKYAANCMLATKISFINEIANICEQVGADVHDVRNGIGADHRIGFHFIYPGMGYGGSCFPKDVKALLHTAREADFEPKLLDAVDKVNEAQKVRMAQRIMDYFAARSKDGKGVRGKTLALWGLAFKANTDDLRESAPVEVVRCLTSQGMQVRIFDPVAGTNGKKLFALEALVDISDEQYKTLEGADALLVGTEWNQFRTPDFERIKSLLRRPVIFDGRNLYQPAQLAGLGIDYFCIGRPQQAPGGSKLVWV